MYVMKSQNNRKPAASRVKAGLGSGQFASPCPCGSGELGLESIGSLYGASTGITEPPRQGQFYEIQKGKGGLEKTAQRAYRTESDSQRVEMAQQINNHPLNRKFWRQPKNAYERKFYPDGVIEFSPSFTCGEDQRRAKSGEKRCFARIWIPPTDTPTPKPPTPGKSDTPKSDDPKKPEEPRSTPPHDPEIPRLVPLKDCVDSSVRSEIQKHLTDGVNRTRKAVERFEKLSSMPEVNRAKSWNNGQERVWFGPYEKGTAKTPFAYVKSRIDAIYSILTHPKLRIKCAKDEPKGIGFSVPQRPFHHLNPQRYEIRPAKNGYYEISLARDWFQQPSPSPSAMKEWQDDRTGVFIHEAAHYTGANRLLWEYYRKRKAIRLARRNAWGARVNAGNYEFYVMSLP
jgi:hypothetical protein